MTPFCIDSSEAYSVVVMSMLTAFLSVFPWTKIIKRAAFSHHLTLHSAYRLVPWLYRSSSHRMTTVCKLDRSKSGARRSAAMRLSILCIILLNRTATPLVPSSCVVDRRSFVAGASIACVSWGAFTPTASAAQNIEDRLHQDMLKFPAPSSASERNGVDNTYFPNFLEGTWEVEQTLTASSAPLGFKFVGGPNGDISIAEKTMAEARSQIGVPVQSQSRYISTKWGIAEDRIFNTQARLNSFAGRTVVASVNYADVGGSNRQSVLALGGSQQDPLQTTLVYFKGPAAQKNFLISHGSESLGGISWAGYEVQRSIFALTNQNTAPPITTDTEFIWRFDEIDSKTIRGRLRIASYLNAQNDKLFFEARNRAVSLQDYTLEMKKL